MSNSYKNSIISVLCILCFGGGWLTGKINNNEDHVQNNTIHSNTNPIQTSSIDVRFSPNDKCLDFIVSVIDSAKSTINVQAYSYTAKCIAEALVRAKKRGVDVRILLDRSQLSAQGSQIYFSQNNNIYVAIDYVPGIAHNKVMIIDDEKVLTGSFNWTISAEKRNAENLLLITDKHIAKKYKDNWIARDKKATKLLPGAEDKNKKMNQKQHKKKKKKK